MVSVPDSDASFAAVAMMVSDISSKINSVFKGQRLLFQ
jgi:hypothetical protein